MQGLEYYAEGNATAEPTICAALMRHHKAFFEAISNDNPMLNSSRWGVDRYSDGLVGIQWLTDRGDGCTGVVGWIWDLQRLLRTRCDQLMASVDHSWYTAAVTIHCCCHNTLLLSQCTAADGATPLLLLDTLLPSQYTGCSLHTLQPRHTAAASPTVV